MRLQIRKVSEFKVSGSEVEIVCWYDEDDPKPEKPTHFDVLVDGEVLNKGKPMMQEPTFRQVVHMMNDRWTTEAYLMVMHDKFSDGVQGGT
jgi:hypothetical protein